MKLIRKNLRSYVSPIKIPSEHYSEPVPARIDASGGASSVKLKPIFVPVVNEQL
jgi:hypothetical protein